MTGLYQAYKEYQKECGKTTYFWMVATRNTTQIVECNLPSAYIGQRFFVFYCETSRAYVIASSNVLAKYSQQFDEEGLELALNSLDGEFINQFNTRINITVRGINEEYCGHIATIFGENGEFKKLEERLFQIPLNTAARLEAIIRSILPMIAKVKLRAYDEYLFIKENLQLHLTVEVA